MNRLLSDMGHALVHVVRDVFEIIRGLPRAVVDMVRALPDALDDIDGLVIAAGWLCTMGLLAWSVTGW